MVVGLGVFGGRDVAVFGKSCQGACQLGRHSLKHSLVELIYIMITVFIPNL